MSPGARALDDSVLRTRIRVVTEKNTVSSPGDTLLIDAECGMCTHFALFVRPRLRDPGSLEILGQQSEGGLEILSQLPPRYRDADTVVLVRAGRPWLRSAAIVRILLCLALPWRVLAVLLWLVPLPLRDLGYWVVARYRKKLWKPPESCAL